MNEENYTHSIELKYGYRDSKDVLHKKVTFSKRPAVSDLILLDMNPQAQKPTQYQQLIRRLMITEFGSLKMPVPLTALVKLDTIDDDALASAADEFLQKSRGERQSEIISVNEVRLNFGIQIADETYDIVKFGNRLTVADNVEADSLKLGNGVARVCFQIGKQISELRNSENNLKIEGQLSLENLSGMDCEDFNVLRIAAEFFRLGIGERK